MAFDDVQFGSEDIVLVIFVLGILIAAAMMQTGGSEYEPSTFCMKAADGVEGNYSQYVDGISCDCVSPERYKKEVRDVPDKVANVTDLNDVLVCDIEYGERTRKLVYPIRQINQTEYSQYEELNNGTASNLTGRID